MTHFHARRARWRKSAILLIAAGLVLSGCDEVARQSAPRQARFPEPISGPQRANDRGGQIKPAGGIAISGGRETDAVSRAELYPAETPAPPPGGRQVTPATGGEAVRLNFVGADLAEVVDVIIGQTLGENYIIDPRVTGSVTLRTTRPIPRAAMLSVLENILALNGAALVQTADLWSVVPADEASAASGVVGPAHRGGAQGRAVYVIPLRYASAASVREIAQTVVSPGREIYVEPSRNYLLFAGSGREANAIQELVNVLDVDQMAGRSFALFPVESAESREVATELESVFGVSGDDGSIQFLPIERMRAILVIAADASYLERARTWVSRLDRADAYAGTGEQVYVYYVRNSRAAELASLLSGVFGAEGQQRPAPRRERPVAPTLRAASLTTTQPGEDGAAAEGGEQTPTPRRAEPPAAPQVTELDIPGGGEQKPTARFVADERNNSIVIVATPEQYRLAKLTLDRLDVMPLQVLIEATIAEVGLNDDLKYGLEWYFQSGDFSTTLVNADNAVTPTLQFPGFNALIDGPSARVVLNALSKVTDVNVISSPQLMVLDNQVARLQVGDQVPIITQQSTTSENTAIINSVQFADTGVILEVTPRVNASGLVTLDVVQEVSDPVATETSGINSPTIQQRKIETTVAVADGQTVALGGLIRDRAENGKSGVPVLKDLPILGPLFGTTSNTSRRTELLVLITPPVLREPQEARMVADELRARLSALNAVFGPI